MPRTWTTAQQIDTWMLNMGRKESEARPWPTSSHLMDLSLFRRPPYLRLGDGVDEVLEVLVLLELLLADEVVELRHHHRHRVLLPHTHSSIDAQAHRAPSNEQDVGHSHAHTRLMDLPMSLAWYVPVSGMDALVLCQSGW